MKIGGIDPSALSNESIFVLPRQKEDGEVVNVVFRAKGLKNMDEFDKLQPEPVAPARMTKDGVVERDTSNKNYKAESEIYNRRRLAYLIVHSLAPSDIEWDTVEMDKPGTWENWEKDLKSAGFSQVECNHIIGVVMEANSLDEAKLKRAREVFLAGAVATSAV